MSKLLKVTMEFDDHIQVLAGKPAEKWLDSVNSMCVMEQIHGRPFPGFPWEHTPKKIKVKPEDPRQMKFDFKKKS